jgi:RNA polymerase sigma-70 factor (ECF subfamily)
MFAISLILIKRISMESKTDEQSLIEQASKNPQAYAQLYDRYVEQIYRYALRRTGDRGLAEDVTSATFEKALRHLSSHGWEGKSYKAWLYLLASQQIIEHHRRNQRYIALTDDTKADIDIEEMAENTMQWADIVQAMGELSENDQEIITLRLIDRLSNSEAAQFLGCSPPKVSVRLYRALGRLRKVLDATTSSEGENDDGQ